MATAVVPVLVGKAVRDGRRVGQHAGLVVTSDDLDGPPLAARTWPGQWIVESQSPVAGTVVSRGAVVRVGVRPTDEPGDR